MSMSCPVYAEVLEREHTMNMAPRAFDDCLLHPVDDILAKCGWRRVAYKSRNDDFHRDIWYQSG